MGAASQGFVRLARQVPPPTDGALVRPVRVPPEIEASDKRSICLDAREPFLAGLALGPDHAHIIARTWASIKHLAQPADKDENQNDDENNPKPRHGHTSHLNDETSLTQER